MNNWLNETDILDARVDLLYKAAELCVEQNQFKYSGHFFRQTKGTNMGNPLSCVIANFFVGSTENELAMKSELLKIWVR